jgi:hypothetical protein
MQDIVFSFDLVLLALIFCLVFPLYFFLIRNQLFTWFDPLLTYIFFNSISIAFVIYMYFVMHTIKLEYFLSFCFCIAGFIIGIITGGFKGLPAWKMPVDISNISILKSYNYALLVDIFMVLCVIIMLGSNVLMLVVKGTLPIFSDNPSEAKILLYTGGWGLVRRINLGLVNFVLAIPLLKLFHPSIKSSTSMKMLYFSCLLLCVLVLISMGSKSSLLMILNIMFAIFLINKTFGSAERKIEKAKEQMKLILTSAKYVFILAVTFVVLITAVSGLESSSTDAVITRLVASGDTFYFFYVFDLAKDFHQTAADFIPHMLNPLLGMLRLKEYEFALGAYIVYYSIGIPLDATSTFGPNAQHPVEGLIYFGAYLAPLYSFFIGFAISLSRVALLRKIGPYPNCLKLLFYVILSSIIILAATDVPYFMQVLYDEIIYGILILGLAGFITLILTKKIVVLK